ncbi:MAG: metalloregulator ArsR/SmtB family transcription factor [Candidatus Dormibacteraeota bacterium]|nr:metalloregulator ArsR/SmtB family transcription factor [Candidatus Dormibacteraeota bacterium]
MPIYDEARRVDFATRVSPSAALELFWLTLRCDGGAGPREHPLFDPRNSAMARLAKRTRDFWGAGEEGFPEVLVIAQHRGLLAGDSLDLFLAELPTSSLHDDDLTLASETPEVRDMIIGRLQRLRGDAGLRRRYLALLRDLWSAVRAEWESAGLPAVERGCETAQRRLDAGEQPADLAPRVSEQALMLLRRPTREILVCPGYFTGRCVWELPGVLLVGLPAHGAGDVSELRARAEALAVRLKALADPTRLAILMRVGQGPTSITEVTREFGISQPAVSVHFRLLRDAELVTGAREGARTMYTLDSRSAEALLDELAGALTAGAGPSMPEPQGSPSGVG